MKPKTKSAASELTGSLGALDSEPWDGDGGEKKDLSVGVPLAQIVPRTLEKVPELPVLAKPRSLEAERFRRLRALLSSEAKKKLQAIVVTSPAPAEGKTLVAMNLALAFASGKNERTLIVDADLRRPSFTRWLTPKPSLGLTEVLEGRTTLEHVVLSIKDSALRVLPTGKPTSDPVEILSSSRIRDIIGQLRKDYDRIIIDTPPIVPFTDADLFAGRADGVLMVVRFGQTPISLARKAIDLVSSAPVIGMVLNDSVKTLADHGSHYEDYYREYYAKDHK